MYVDPKKMKSARERRALTQENLAHQARVNVRTIQRAETGLPIRAETLAEIAAVLGVPPVGLLAVEPFKEPEVLEAEAEAEVQTSLKRVTNADQVVRALERAVMSAFECSCEPTEATMPTLRKAIKQVESLIRDPWCIHDQPPLRFTSLIDRLESVAALNGSLAELERQGMALYMSTSSQFVRVPQGQEEGHMAVSIRQSPEYAFAARFLIADYVSERVRVSPQVNWPLEIEYDDGVPF
ncbi:helix-turn-helix transcriptional regulator [Sphingomonas sp. ASV193]|uniref:helix-turn-helix domain-containing protein n=1 Tax=Sphingomonas sp. ASV193 TaxID=3144405 RepID=UPI0032E8A6B4